MRMVFDREHLRVFEGTGPQSGTYGQMSLSRLCDTLEACGEIKSHERITHLEIVGDLMRFRVEQRDRIKSTVT